MEDLSVNHHGGPWALVVNAWRPIGALRTVAVIGAGQSAQKRGQVGVGGIIDVTVGAGYWTAGRSEPSGSMELGSLFLAGDVVFEGGSGLELAVPGSSGAVSSASLWASSGPLA
jgi:hypothetical protein